MVRTPGPFILIRLFPTFLICSLLGGVWGLTCAPILGIIAGLIHVSSGGWCGLNLGVLTISLFFVGRVAGTRSRGGVLIRAKRLRLEPILGVMSFAVAYGLAMSVIWEISQAF